jgi:transposase-like protein
MISKTKGTIKCPKCSSQETKKRGIRHTSNRGKVQRYFCHSCKHSFIVDDGFNKMKNNEKKITLCLDLFFRGVSTRKIQEHLQAFYPHNSCYSTIYRWVVKYANMISKYTDSLKLNVGQECQVDEVEFHRRKNHQRKEGIDVNWFIDSIDPTTRFMIASEYFKSRGQAEFRKLLQEIRKKTQNNIKVVTTDGFRVYRMAISYAFGYRNLRSGKLIHHSVNASKGEGFNHPIERLHNTLRQRTKIFRGFHGSVESAKAIMKGLEIYYNFIRTHQAIGMTPQEAAIPELKLGLNKWLNLIHLSKLKN